MAIDPVTDRERFFKSFIVSESSACWFWLRQQDKDGYGLFKIGSLLNNTRRQVRAHRWSYEMFRGQIRDGVEPDHLCQNKSCVNPFHIELVTHRVNLRRGRGATKKICNYGHLRSESGRLTKSGVVCRECHRLNGIKFRKLNPGYARQWHLKAAEKRRLLSV